MSGHRSSGLFGVGLALGLAASCALPELTIDPSLDDDSGEDGGAGGTGANQGGNAGTGGSGASGQGGGGSGSGGKGGSSGSSAGKGGDSSGGTGGKGGSSGSSGSSGTSGGGPACTDDNCSAGQACCGDQCRDLQTDEAHCGGCNAACAATEVCEGGECVCPNDGEWCGDRCVNPDTDRLHCGRCDSPCSEDQMCTNGTCTGPCGASFNVASGAWVTSPGAAGSCWRGYAWVFASPESTATPADYSSCGTPCNLCVTGQVAGRSDFSGTVILGVNVNQPRSGQTAGTLIPGGAGLEVTFTRMDGTPLRVQISGEGSSDRWCYDVPSSSATTVRIPWSSFNTQCWAGGMGTAYGNQPIHDVDLLVPGAMTPVPFDYCLLSFREY